MTGEADAPALLVDDAGMSSLDGVALGPAPSPERVAAHPNTAVAVDHVVVTTPDLARTVAALDELGVTIRRYRDVPGTVRRQAFVRLGEAVLELVGPAEPTGDGPAELWGWVATVDDADAASRVAGGHLGPWRDAVQPGRRIASARREAGLPVPFAVMTAGR